MPPGPFPVSLHSHSPPVLFGGVNVLCMRMRTPSGKGKRTRVIGCPKTIDGDLKATQVPISFGFDTACKVRAALCCTALQCTAVT